LDRRYVKKKLKNDRSASGQHFQIATDFIESTQFCFHQVFPEKNSLKLIKNYNVQVNWFVYLVRSLSFWADLFVVCNVYMYCSSNKVWTALSRGPVSSNPSLHYWLFIFIYGKNGPRNWNSHAQISLYRKFHVVSTFLEILVFPIHLTRIYNCSESIDLLKVRWKIDDVNSDWRMGHLKDIVIGNKKLVCLIWKNF
jgi:hypothetical protein